MEDIYGVWRIFDGFTSTAAVPSPQVESSSGRHTVPTYKNAPVPAAAPAPVPAPAAAPAPATES